MARDALATWAHFDVGWVVVEPANAAIVIGDSVAVGAQIRGFWFGGVCRIESIVDNDDQFGFTYVTTRHIAQGAERFLISRSPDGTVWYTIDVVARPASWYARAAQPVFERYRKQFRADSVEAMRRAVNL